MTTIEQPRTVNEARDSRISEGKGCSSPSSGSGHGWTHLDLFSGIGGFGLAAKWNGIETQAFCEIDPWARKILRRHWPETKIYDDVRQLNGHAHEGVSIITGGFPCQDISCAGKGAGLDGERSGLWKELHRIICEARPRYAVMENVSALTYRGLGRVLGDLAESGYGAEWMCLPASRIGACHRRERIWILAYADGERLGDASLGHATIRQLERLSPKDFWLPIVSESPICGVDDGIPGRVDRLRGLGNAIVPQVAYILMRSILQSANVPND